MVRAAPQPAVEKAHDDPGVLSRVNRDRRPAGRARSAHPARPSRAPAAEVPLQHGARATEAAQLRVSSLAARGRFRGPLDRTPGGQGSQDAAVPAVAVDIPTAQRGRARPSGGRTRIPEPLREASHALRHLRRGRALRRGGGPRVALAGLEKGHSPHRAPLFRVSEYSELIAQS